jgi:hypothetical protein
LPDQMPCPTHAARRSRCRSSAGGSRPRSPQTWSARGGCRRGAGSGRRSRPARANAARRARASRRVERRSLRPESRDTGRQPQARWSWIGVSEPGGTTSENNDSEPSSARYSSHWPIPPPMPLSGAAAWYSSGSHCESASNSANRGSIVAQASCGEEAPAIAACTSATNARMTGVSRTNSAIRSSSRFLTASKRRGELVLNAACARRSFTASHRD